MIDKPLIAYPAFSRVGASPDLLVVWAFLAVTGVDRCGGYSSPGSVWLEDSFPSRDVYCSIGSPT
jgi:hypothetical protein